MIFTEETTYIIHTCKVCCLTLSKLQDYLSPRASRPEKPARRQTAPPNLLHLRTKHRTPNESTRSHGLRIRISLQLFSDTESSGQYHPSFVLVGLGLNSSRKS